MLLVWIGSTLPETTRLAAAGSSVSWNAPRRRNSRRSASATSSSTPASYESLRSVGSATLRAPLSGRA